MLPGATSGVATGYGMDPFRCIKTYIYTYKHISIVIGTLSQGESPHTPVPRFSPSSTASRGYASPTNHPPHSILTTHSRHISPVLMRYHRYPLGRKSTRPSPTPPLPHNSRSHFPSHQPPTTYTHDPHPHRRLHAEATTPPTRPPPSTTYNRSPPYRSHSRPLPAR